MIRLAHVSKAYGRGQVKAVDDLSLEVKPGEIFGFLGPNGAGKTTTIKMLVGLLLPDSGTVEVAGVNVVTNPLEAKRRIGFVPDTPAVWERLTAREYLNFLGDVYEVPPAERWQRLEELLKSFELWEALDDPLKSYSHGMRQKVVVAGALLAQPPVLILDEPMVSLDPRSAYVLKDLLRRHADAGSTVFFSTHVLEVAERFCDRVGILSHGHLIASGTLDEVRARVTGGAHESLEEVFLTLTEAKLPEGESDR
ncbi:MAG TPA: ABC transporter ATP-binding protein [Firmicutes bacterium]|nr:ABC transporter ATP-binding protein [Bacillota bacterium]